MPFENLSRTATDPDLQALTEGIGESLIQGLKNISAMHIVERENMKHVLKEQAFAQTGMVDARTAPKIGALLGASVLMVGSYQLLGDQLRINARFIRADSGEVMQDKAFSVTGKWKEGAFQCMDELAQKFVASFNVQTTPSEKQVLTQSIQSTKNYDAYTHYLKGRDYYLNFNHADFYRSIEEFKQALALDGNYSLAQAGLATVYYYLGFLDREVGNEFLASFRQAEEHGRRAVELAPDSALGHLALARVYMETNRLDQGRQEVEIALRLNASDPMTRFESIVMRANERLRNGGEMADTSEKSLVARVGPQLQELEKLKHEAPKEALLFLFTGYNYTNLGLQKRANADLERALQLNPSLGIIVHMVQAEGHIHGFMAYLGQARMDKALKELDRASTELNQYAILDRGFKNPAVDLVQALRFLAQKQLIQAIATLQKALQDNPKNKDTLEFYMRIAASAGRPDLVMALGNQLEAVLKEEADNGQIASAKKLGELYLEFGNAAAAIPYLQAFYQHLPNAQTRQLIQRAQMGGGVMQPLQPQYPVDEGGDEGY